MVNLMMGLAAHAEPDKGMNSMRFTVRDFVSACLLCATAAVITAPARAADAAAGKAVYAAKCKGCHGAEGVPPAGMAKALGIKPMSDPG